jgi:hypothetical protein
MLAYLDALIAAIAVHDADAMTRLLADPMARVLPRAARNEVSARLAAMLDGTSRATAALGAPLRLLQLHHQTAQLLNGRADGDDPIEYRPQPPALRAPQLSRQSRRQRVSGRATNRATTGRCTTATGERGGLLVEQLSEIDR